MTQPHIGNTGVNEEDDESDRCVGRGLRRPLGQPLRQQLARQPVPRRPPAAAQNRGHDRCGHAGALVRHIRTRGAMNAASVIDEHGLGAPGRGGALRPI